MFQALSEVVDLSVESPLQVVGMLVLLAVEGVGHLLRHVWELSAQKCTPCIIPI